MLRLTMLLCAVMFVTLLIAGEDNGQMRPGLAQAVAQGEEIIVLERRRATPPVAVEEPATAAAAAPAPEAAGSAVVEQAAYIPEPASTGTAPTPEPVFTLSSLPTVTADAPVEETAEAAPQAASGAEIWYVVANSVNVREGPSTDASIIDRLGRGEAVTIAFEEGSEWARVSIEGDGLEGYVALRFLSPDAP